jgi:hypothetical protein
MSRKEEQAKNALWRWQAASKQGLNALQKNSTNKNNNISVNKRPRLASECKSIPQCEEVRSKLLKDISKKVEEIQNSKLEQDEIRKLNEEINKLIYIKGHWERQIRSLGGPDYRDHHSNFSTNNNRNRNTNSGSNNKVDDGVVRIGNVIYFGMAKKLPEVLDSQIRKNQSSGTSNGGNGDDYHDKKRLRPHYENNNNTQFNHQYYGLQYDNDLTAIEFEAQTKLRERLSQEWSTSTSSSTFFLLKEEIPPPKIVVPVGLSTTSTNNNNNTITITSHWDETFTIPNQHDIDDAIFQYKKRVLLRKYL